MRPCQHFEYLIIRVCVIAGISPSFVCMADISPSFIISLAIIVNRLASIWLTTIIYLKALFCNSFQIIYLFNILNFLKIQYWWACQMTCLNRCENSQTIICNLSRFPPPHDQSPAYYSGHTVHATTLLPYLHFFIFHFN